MSTFQNESHVYPIDIFPEYPSTQEAVVLPFPKTEADLAVDGVLHAKPSYEELFSGGTYRGMTARVPLCADSQPLTTRYLGPQPYSAKEQESIADDLAMAASLKPSSILRDM